MGLTAPKLTNHSQVTLLCIHIIKDITSHALILKRYNKHRVLDGPTENNGYNPDVFEAPTNSYLDHSDEDAKEQKLSMIRESRESDGELDSNRGFENIENGHLSVPKIIVNTTDFEEPEEKVNGFNGSIQICAGNNNESSEVATSVSGPTFYGAAVVESVTVAQVEIDVAESLETPEVKVMCVREESLDKPDDDDVVLEEKQVDVNSEETLNESQENDNEQVIDEWIICQFLK